MTIQVSSPILELVLYFVARVHSTLHPYSFVYRSLGEPSWTTEIFEEMVEPLVFILESIALMDGSLIYEEDLAPADRELSS